MDKQMIAKELVKVAKGLIAVAPRDKSLKEFIRANQTEIENGIEKWAERLIEEAQNDAYVDIYDFDKETEDIDEGPYTVGYAEVVVDVDYEVENEPNEIDISSLSEKVIEHLSEERDNLYYAAEINELYEKDYPAYEKYADGILEQLVTDRLFDRFMLSMVPRIFQRINTEVEDVSVKYKGDDLFEVTIEPTIKGQKILWTVKDEERLKDRLTDEFCESHITGRVPSSMSGD